ncbi:MAG: OFA family MFS transporter [Syntrophobacteraceae bacterium]
MATSTADAAAKAGADDLVSSRMRYIIVGFLVSLVLGLVYAWSIFVLPLEKQFGWTRAQTQLTFTISIIALSIGMIFGGRLSDRLGPRKLGIAGAVLTTLGFFLASYTNALWMLYLSYGVFAGLGVGVVNICATSTVVRWYPDRRGFALGLLTMGFGLAGFLFGSLLGQFINALGWQWAFRIVSLASLIVLVGGSFIFQFPPLGWSPIPAGAAKSAKPAPSIKNFEWNQMLKTSPWWVWWGWDLVLCIAGLMVMAHVVPLAVEKGMEKSQAAWAMGMFALFNGAGRLSFGWLWDHMERKTVMALDAVVMTVGLLGLRFLTQALGFPGLFISIICTGLAYGGLPAINSAFIVSSFGPKNSGLHIGLGTTPMMAAVFLGPYLGSFVQMSYGYDTTMIIGGLLAACGAVLAHLIGNAQELDIESL